MLLAGVAVLSSLLLAAMAILLAREASIGSDQYNRIAYAKELTADILPPPLYLVGPMYTMGLLDHVDEAEQQKLRAEIRKDLQDYQDRMQRWSSTNDLPDNIQRRLEDELDKSSQKVILLFQELLTAKNMSDKEFDELHVRIYEAFLDHRQAVEYLVKDAEAYATSSSIEGASLAASYRSLLVLVAVISICAILTTSFFIIRASLASLGVDPAELQKIALRAAEGDYDVKLPVSRNENSVANAMEKMLASLREAQKAQLENLRVKQALDSVTTNVMIADPDANIVYTNTAVTAMMRRAEADIRKALPNFDASSLLGKNMDIFHRNPDHQRNIMKSLTNTYFGKAEVGGRTFTVIANPVFSNGKRIGTVVEWADRTAEVAIEKEVAAMVSAASLGDFTRQISLENKDGFFANLSRGLNELVNTIEIALNDIRRMLGAMARGDLSERITREYQGTFGQLKEDANSTADKLTEIIGRIRTSSSAILAAANEIAQGNADLSQRTEEQASSLEETASSMEEMTSTVKQSAENALRANDLAQAAQAKAKEGGSVVSRAVQAMQEISDSSKRISDIISVIDEIAFQTNLLALNAAVEAARAGEQGRGFAVVAGEVRNLAQRSAGAAKEIKDLIRDSVGKVQDGRQLVNASGETLQEIVASVEKVSNMMQEIAQASQEQTSGIEQVNTAVAQMDEMTQQNAALVEEASAAGASLADQANAMYSVVEFFSVGDEPSAALSAAGPARSRFATKSAARGKPAKKAPPRAPQSDDEWEEF